MDQSQESNIAFAVALWMALSVHLMAKYSFVLANAEMMPHTESAMFSFFLFVFRTWI
jgi:hypothetical protein